MSKKKKNLLIGNNPLTKSYALDYFGHKCMCCGIRHAPMELEHIVPISVDASLKDDPDNFQILCRRCNKVKMSNIMDHRKDEQKYFSQYLETYMPTRVFVTQPLVEYCRVRRNGSKLVPVYVVNIQASIARPRGYDYCHMNIFGENGLSWGASNLFFFMANTMEAQENFVHVSDNYVKRAISQCAIRDEYDFYGSLKELQEKDYLVALNQTDVVVNPLKSLRSCACRSFVDKEAILASYLEYKRRGGYKKLGYGLPTKRMEYAHQREWVKKIIARKTCHKIIEV